MEGKADFEFFATCLPGAEGLLADELRGLGVRRVRPLAGGVAFFGTSALVLRVCLWSRLVGRVNVTAGRVGASDAEALYAGVRGIAWEEVVAVGASIAVRASGTNAALRNTHFTALKVKDALCDRLAEVRGARPEVNTAAPDALIEVRLRDERATVSLDLSGRSLARRSYLGEDEGEKGPALVAQAASLLALVGAGTLFEEGFQLVDPAGEGSILCREAAELREDRAPGLLREHWGFSGWAAFPEAAWDELLSEADGRCEAREAALSAAGEGGLREAGSGEGGPRADALQLVASVGAAFRADDDAEAVAARAACVAAARRSPAGSRFAFAGFGGMAARFRVHPTASLHLGRGRSETTVEVFDEPPREPVTIAVANPAGGADLPVEVNDAGAVQFAARLRKVYRERRRWAAREDIHCYRLYDADLPEYACAIDLYEGAGADRGALFAQVAEYQAPKSVDEGAARARFEDVLALVPAVLGIPSHCVFSKARKQARGGSQYRDAGGRSFVTRTVEDGLLCEIDLGGYLDTGIFLDHRVTREMVGKMARGKRFLNLFAYTGVATLHAAAGGAVATTTVDLSATYLDWARRNLKANGFPVGEVHRLVRADVTRWIAEARRAGERYDLIFADPPTFSNSKAMGRRTWDVQRDHAELLIGVSRLLASGGVAVFSCNLRSFRPDIEILARYGVEMEDITASTIPHDFERNPRIHRCYLVRRK